jgi:hypothetical protein
MKNGRLIVDWGLFEGGRRAGDYGRLFKGYLWTNGGRDWIRNCEYCQMRLMSEMQRSIDTIGIGYIRTSE